MNLLIVNKLNFIQSCVKMCGFLILLLLVFCSPGIFAQSTDSNFPTPLISNEISGTIPARAVGDARFTRYYYQFNGNQGDVFINVRTNNLNGDIDVFTDKQRNSLTKITIYSDSAENETGRVIYLRKAENLILRIEARSPNDDPATFSIKFAGSFAPAQITAEDLRTKEPKVTSENQGTVKVNSVGTIIETPKPQKTSETKSVEIAAVKTEDKANENKSAEIPEKSEPTENVKAVSENIKPDKKTKNKKSAAKIVTNTNSDLETKIPADVETENKQAETKPIVEKAEVAENPEIPITENKLDETANINLSDEENKTSAGKTIVTIEKTETKITAETPEKTELNPVGKSFDPSQLANVRLIISLKNGDKVEHPMSEVVWFNVNQGVLTVITNGGKTEKFSILDVAKMTIQ